MKHPMKVPSSLPWIVLAIFVAIAGGVASRYWPAHVNAEAPADGAAAPLPPVAVQAVAAELQTLRPSLDLVGTIVAIPERTASVSSQLGGWVQKLEVVEGQSVQAGAPLVTLDSRTAQTDLERAQAIAAEKQAVLARLKRGYLPQELEAAQQDRDKAKAAMEAAKGEVAVLEDLRARNEISAVQFETKQKLFTQAEAAFASASAHAKLIEQGTAIELIDEAQAFLDAAKVDVEHATLALKWCHIASPIAGIVVLLPARQGQFIDRAVPLATIMDLSEVFVHLRVPSADFAKVRIGTTVDIELSAAPGKKILGVISRIGGQADPLTGNLDMFATVKNGADLLLRPGLSCHAQVWLPEIPKAVVIPVAAVADNSGTAVATVIREGQAHEVEIELGTETHDLVQVLKGISPGDMVATAGGYGLPDGCPVKIVADLAAARP
jgi:multidrug efflux pump subunit AcrA (membrane-fusion protein)